MTMNPEPQPSGCGVSAQPAEGASLAPHSVSDDGRTEVYIPAPHPTRSIHCHPSDDMGFVYPPEMLAEPEYESDYDFEEDARERELLMDDLADDNDDFARSDEDGWYYSDED
jgi:hypothetical protein